MHFKEIITSWFTFTRRDQIAVITLVSLITFIFFLPRLIPRPTLAEISPADSFFRKTPEPRPDFTTYEKPGNAAGGKAFEHKAHGKLFAFDPNTLEEAGWKSLGVRPRTISTILRFRSKGGRFRTPEDLAKVYGFFPDEIARLTPFVRITSSHAGPDANKTASGKLGYYARPAAAAVPIDINAADTTVFASLPGIGPTLSRRIVAFRNKLGGFYAVKQVAETFGLADSVFRKIEPLLLLSDVIVTKIDLNDATVETLAAHPYIRNLASPIVAYRTQHGPFKALPELKRVMRVTDEVYRKLEPYLELK